VPPFAASYHWMPVPVTIKLLTAGKVLEQNDCVAVPVGVGGVVVMVAVTSSRAELSQLFVV
jgi:hypothetical protein